MNQIPTVTKNLLIINVLFFMGTLALNKYGIDLHEMLGLHFFMAEHFHIYQLFTYMFLHDGFQHIFFNMFAVWMFGRVMENVWGAKRFLFFYLACGVGAGLMQELVQFIHYEMVLSNYDAVKTGLSTIPLSQYLDMMLTVGASGAVYGILLGYGVTFPNQPLFIIPFPFPIKAKWLVTGYVILELMLGIGNRPGDNVAHFAHLGGMLIGLIIILFWKKKDNNRNEIHFRY
jgi:membrane associated rhomboid family serine protease